MKKEKFGLKEKDLDRTKRRLKEFNKIMQTGTSTEYDKGFRDGRASVFREIEKLFEAPVKGFKLPREGVWYIVIEKKEWEEFKNDKQKR